MVRLMVGPPRAEGLRRRSVKAQCRTLGFPPQSKGSPPNSQPKTLRYLPNPVALRGRSQSDHGSLKTSSNILRVEVRQDSPVALTCCFASRCRPQTDDPRCTAPRRYLYLVGRMSLEAAPKPRRNSPVPKSVGGSG